jgi:methylenetetrahydrofolate dehydrogenase (NADP+) / methenyltetrahydrofolate cyclohydrolase
VAARVIDGKAIAAQLRSDVAEHVRALAQRGITPGLAAVLVGDHEASRIYVAAKQKACAEVGIRSERIDLPGDVGQDRVVEIIRGLNDDRTIDGIIVQLPVPDQISEFAIQRAVSPSKDVDGLHPANLGSLARGRPVFFPATPYGIVELLIRSGVEIPGSDVVIVGRGELVGLPLALMLAQRTDRANATVTLCHTKTRDLARHTRAADILVAATGVARLITADMVKVGAAVIDVGINREPDGLVGDVDFERVREVAGSITPVPGGVGPMTVAMLLRNTLEAAERGADVA